MCQKRKLFIITTLTLFILGCGNSSDTKQSDQSVLVGEKLFELLFSFTEGLKSPSKYNGTIIVSSVGSMGSEPYSQMNEVLKLSISKGALNRTSLPIQKGEGSVQFVIDWNLPSIFNSSSPEDRSAILTATREDPNPDNLIDETIVRTFTLSLDGPPRINQ